MIRFKTLGRLARGLKYLTAINTNNIWCTAPLGADFITHSFLTAAKADPAAKFSYNDFNIERCCNAKINGTCAMLLKRPQLGRAHFRRRDAGPLARLEIAVEAGDEGNDDKALETSGGGGVNGGGYSAYKIAGGEGGVGAAGEILYQGWWGLVWRRGVVVVKVCDFTDQVCYCYFVLCYTHLLNQMRWQGSWECLCWVGCV